MYANVTNNPKYKKFVFSNEDLKSYFSIVDNLYTGILDKGIMDGVGKSLFSSSLDILTIIAELIISADISINNNNLTSSIINLSTAYEFILKYGLIMVEFKAKDDEKDLNENFQGINDIKIWKIEEKVTEYFKGKTLFYFDEMLNADIFNNIKHLNNVRNIYLHKGLSLKIDLMNVKRKAIDYFQDALTVFKYALEATLVLIAQNKAYYLTSQDYIDFLEAGLTPPKDSEKICSPWFKEYIKTSLKDIELELIKDGYFINW